jgi:hypothetical protein
MGSRGAATRLRGNDGEKASEPSDNSPHTAGSRFAFCQRTFPCLRGPLASTSLIQAGISKRTTAVNGTIPRLTPTYICHFRSASRKKTDKRGERKALTGCVVPNARCRHAYSSKAHRSCLAHLGPRLNTSDLITAANSCFGYFNLQPAVNPSD